MIGLQFAFRLEEESPVETEGGRTSATWLAGRKYSEGDYFDGEYEPTYIITGQTGGFTVRQSDVREIVDLHAEYNS